MAFDSFETSSATSAQRLVDMQAASKLAAQDATLYGFSQPTQEFASRFMGWTTLSTNPPYSPDDIMAFAGEQRRNGLTDVVLIGQGGSTQASMTMSELLRHEGQLDVRFHTMDCLSPEYVRSVLEQLDPATTVFIISSKSGSTIEPTMVFNCVWQWLCQRVGQQAAGQRFVAITDPGSHLQQVAQDLGFAKVFSGLPTVGGRFSALSVFGLVPFALMGVDLSLLLQTCAQAQQACCADSLDNPAIRLAGFIDECRLQGRDKIAFSFSPSCSSFGLWLEQLIAESTGKEGRGVLPTTEPDLQLLMQPRSDRMAVLCAMQLDERSLQPDQPTVAQRLEAVQQNMPAISTIIESPIDAAAHMVVWEYAVAMVSALIGQNPFDQPDVETTKVAVRGILYNADASSVTVDASSFDIACDDAVAVGCTLSPRLQQQVQQQPQTLQQALQALLGSLEPGDFFSLNAFLNAYDPQRTDALEQVRHQVAQATGCAACLEMGPRYLHSIGQFQKGGFDKGVFLVLSSDEQPDMPIPGETFTLGQMAAVQARGDFAALCDSGRRALLVHLSSSTPEVLSQLVQKVAASL